MTGYFLGVDIGGSQSHAVISTSDGQIIGFGQAGAGNHETVSFDGLAGLLISITAEVLAYTRTNYPGALGACRAGITRRAPGAPRSRPGC